MGDRQKWTFVDWEVGEAGGDSIAYCGVEWSGEEAWIVWSCLSEGYKERKKGSIKNFIRKNGKNYESIKRIEEI